MDVQGQKIFSQPELSSSKSQLSEGSITKRIIVDIDRFRPQLGSPETGLASKLYGGWNTNHVFGSKRVQFRAC